MASLKLMSKFLKKKNLKELFKVLFPGFADDEYFVLNNVLSDNLESSDVKSYNLISLKIMFFVVFGSIILDMFVFPSYYFHSNGIFFKISTQKMKMYPLFLSNKWDVNTLNRSYKFLYTDLLKLLKCYGINPNKSKTFEKFSDFIDLLKILYHNLFPQ